MTKIANTMGDCFFKVYILSDANLGFQPFGFVGGNYDQDTSINNGNSVTANATSGGKPYGDPIPGGYYEILDQAQNPDSFRLDAIDENPRDDIHEDTGRKHFRLHKPGNTTGCIAVESEEKWKNLKDLINSTKTNTTNDNFSPWWQFWGADGNPITRYGILQVFPDD